jgi:N-acetylmuramoyl-L-alanine amidase
MHHCNNINKINGYGGNIMAYRVYISASTQRENIGVEQYGNEQDRMMYLADRVKYFLETQGNKFIVFRNQLNWTLRQTIDDCNKLACAIFVDNHTNAGGKGCDGTEVYHHKQVVNGKRLATLLNNQIAPISLGSDRGVLSDLTLYNNGLAVLRETLCPASLIEHIYHTDIAEVRHFVKNIDLFAKAEAMAICQYFNEKWIEPQITEKLNYAQILLQCSSNGPDWVDKINKLKVQDEYKYLDLLIEKIYYRDKNYSR